MYRYTCRHICICIYIYIYTHVYIYIYVYICRYTNHISYIMLWRLRVCAARRSSRGEYVPQPRLPWDACLIQRVLRDSWGVSCLFMCPLPNERFSGCLKSLGMSPCTFSTAINDILRAGYHGLVWLCDWSSYIRPYIQHIINYCVLPYVCLCHTTITYYTIPYHIIPYTILYYTISYHTILYYTTIYYTILQASGPRSAYRTSSSASVAGAPWCTAPRRSRRVVLVTIIVLVMYDPEAKYTYLMCTPR